MDFTLWLIFAKGLKGNLFHVGKWRGLLCIIKMIYIHQFTDPHHCGIIARGLIPTVKSTQMDDFEIFAFRYYPRKSHSFYLNIKEVNKLDLLSGLLF